MGLFSFLSRKKRRATSLIQQDVFADSPEMRGESPEKMWRHSISHLTVVSRPFGETPGTVLEPGFIYGSLIAITRAISQSTEDKLHFAEFAHELESMAISGGISIERYEIVGLSHESILGYSARMSASAKKFTVLFGDPDAVARASTPFHSEIVSATTISNNTTGASNESVIEYFVLAIDGIAYAALTLRSEFH